MTKKTKQPKREASIAKTVEPLAYTVKQFCEAVGISLRTFYTLREKKKAPAVIRIGRRTLIRVEAAEQWLRKCEGKA